RIEVAAVLMDVGNDQILIFFKRVEDAVPMVHIDVHISDALDAVLLSQCLDDDTQIIKHAKARGIVASGVMQTANRLKAARTLSPHYARQPVERRANHACRRFEYPR